MDEGRRSDQAAPGLGQDAKVVAGSGGGHHLRFGKLHLHRVQLARLRLVHFRSPHPRYCVYQDPLFFYCFVHAAMRHWSVGRGIATINYHTNVFNTYDYTDGVVGTCSIIQLFSQQSRLFVFFSSVDFDRKTCSFVK